jgi:glycosyltransferase involved in cell wall biosynthesis
MIVSEHDAARPLVSVIVPTYNSARTVERCLAALAAQRTPHPFEVLVVDSGHDATCELATRALPQVRTICLPQRAVAPVARNAGASAARGEILAFIDSDAYADGAWIDNVVLAGTSGFDLVCGSIANANPHSAVARAEQLLMFNEFLPDSPGGPSWFALSGNMVLPRESFERFGPFVAVRAAEDVVFSRRLLAAGGRVLFFPALRAFHDNRTRLRPYLRNQFIVGKHTAIARRLVRFADTNRYWVFVMLLPIAPVAKLAKIAARMAVRRPRHLLALARELPLFFAGICAYSIGLVGGALSSAPAIAEDEREAWREADGVAGGSTQLTSEPRRTRISSTS